jgi:gluconate 5-dehydrogenase
MPTPTLTIFDLSGQRALVTGSSQGIGIAIARGLAGAGAHVIVNGRDAAKTAAAAQKLAAEGLPVSAAAFDVTDPGAVQAAVARLEGEAPIDILVNNAGIQHRAPLVDFPAADYRRVMTTNADSVFFVTQAVGRGMVARGRGKIINIGSLMSELGRASIVPYTASKGAVKMMTKGMCAEWAKHNIQINGISPGYIETELNRALMDDKAFSAWVTARTPAARWGKIDDLVGAAVFLASSASDYVNGQMLIVDGGMSAVV